MGAHSLPCLTSPIHKLILYEPPIRVKNVPVYLDEFIDRLDALLAAGKREEVLILFIQEVLWLPSDEFELFRASPTWPTRLAAAHTPSRELPA